MALTSGDKKWIKEVFTGGLKQTVLPVLDDIKGELGGIKVELKEHREMIVYVTEQVGELTIKVDKNTEQIEELDTKIDRVDRKLTVVSDHLGTRIDNHEKRIRQVESVL